MSDAPNFDPIPQAPRLQEIRANLLDRLQEAKEHGWLGEVAAIETSIGMPDFRAATGRATPRP